MLMRRFIVTLALFETHWIFPRNKAFGVENNAFCSISFVTFPIFWNTAHSMIAKPLQMAHQCEEK